MALRCEGHRRYGGAFTLGPVKWVQCENDACVMITVTQGGETQTLPACIDCWWEAIGNDAIEIESVTPIPTEKEEQGE